MSRENGSAFWLNKKLEDFDDQEWEAVCDGCGRCCLHKLEDIETGELHYTRVACQLLDIESCRCRHYEQRFNHVPDCISIRQELQENLKWLPRSCAYRLLAEGKALADWHPLISQNKDSVIDAGISVKHFAINESEDMQCEHYLIDDL